MPLSNEARAALEARAAGLREEVAVTRAEADVALREKAQDINDEKLVQEVKVLEAEVANAQAMRNSVVGDGSVDSALKAMEAAAAPVVKTDEPPAVAEKLAELPDPFADGGSN